MTSTCFKTFRYHCNYGHSCSNLRYTQ